MDPQFAPPQQAPQPTAPFGPPSPDTAPQNPVPQQPKKRLGFIPKFFITLAVMIVGAGIISAIFAFGNKGIAFAQTWVVTPTGSATGSGTDINAATTIQAALDRAQPGDIIELQPGVYKVSSVLKTKRPGTASKPIVIKGSETGLDISGRNKTVLVGEGHVIDIDHSYYSLDGFTINGQPNLDFAKIPTTPDELIAYKNQNQSSISNGRLIYVGASASNVTGVVINNMFLTGAGGECVRMRSFTTNSIVSNSRIYRCGFVSKAKDYAYHNGEGVYIGTSPKSTDQPFYKNDDSSGNIVRNNIIDTYASECVNIKENASKNLVDGNQCRYGLGDSAASESILEVRGKDNIIANNFIQHSRGYGIKLWSDEPQFGGNNIVANNKLSDITAAIITVKQQPAPKEVCGNKYEGNFTVVGLPSNDIAKQCSQSYGGGVSVTPGSAKAPKLVSLSPSNGLTTGGTTVTIKIEDFPAGVPAIAFGSQRALDVKRTDATTITLKTPVSSAPGSVPVVVQLDNTSVSGLFTYSSPEAPKPTPSPSPTTPPSSGGGGPVNNPTPGAVIYSNDFTSMNDISKVSGGSWKISDQKELQLADPKDNVSVGNNNIAVINKDLSSSSYTLSVSAKVKGSDNKFDDFSVIFDYKDSANYSFVSMTESNDPKTSGIFTVRSGTATQVADITALITPDVYYAVTITRSQDGTVTVKQNGAQVATGNVGSAPGQKVGFGSRNNSARFDDLVVR